MDRDNRWERTEKAYRLLTETESSCGLTPEEVVEASYAEDITDEFIEPTRISSGLVKAGDGWSVSTSAPTAPAS